MYTTVSEFGMGRGHRKFEVVVASQTSRGTPHLLQRNHV